VDGSMVVGQRGIFVVLNEFDVEKRQMKNQIKIKNNSKSVSQNNQAKTNVSAPPPNSKFQFLNQLLFFKSNFPFPFGFLGFFWFWVSRKFHAA
jgi:hypothetical protein